MPKPPPPGTDIFDLIAKNANRATGTSRFGGPMVPGMDNSVRDAGSVHRELARRWGFNPAEFDAGLTEAENMAARARLAAQRAANTVPRAAGRRAAMVITPEMAAEMAARQGLGARALGALGTAGRVASSPATIAAQVLLTPDVAGAPETQWQELPPSLVEGNLDALQAYLSGETDEVPLPSMGVPETEADWTLPPLEELIYARDEGFVPRSMGKKKRR